jgi:hypothetical protein
MKNARLLCSLVLVGVAAACSAAAPTGPLPDTPRNSGFYGSGSDSLPKTLPDTTKQGG